MNVDAWVRKENKGPTSVVLSELWGIDTERNGACMGLNRCGLKQIPWRLQI